MTGSHEVRGSIPLGSTNNCNDLGRQFGDADHFTGATCFADLTSDPAVARFLKLSVLAKGFRNRAARLKCY